MSPLSRLSIRPWIIVPVLAAIFLVICDFSRIKRIEEISTIGDATLINTADLGNSGSSATTYRNRLVIPEHDNATYEWLDETNAMVTQHAWRLRHINYENAPTGHD
ncbi:MAG TPA: hypothetical protein VIM69_05415, partial [Opitutaceae bacterium]